MLKDKFKRQSANSWAKEMNLTVINFSKGFTLEEYHDCLIDYQEFLNRISICEIKKPDNVNSRREAKLFLDKLKNNK